MAELFTEVKALMGRVSDMEAKMLDLKMENSSLRTEIEKLKSSKDQEQVASSCSTPGSQDQKEQIVIDRLQREVHSLRKEMRTLGKKQEVVHKRLGLLDGLQKSLNRAFVEFHRKKEAEEETKGEGATNEMAKPGSAAEKVCQNLERRIKAMENCKEGHEYIQQRLQVLESKLDGLENVTEATSCNTDSSSKDLERRIEVVENHSIPTVTSRLNLLENQLCSRLPPKVFHVLLNASKDFSIPDQAVKLDKCLESGINDLFDVTECVLNPRKKGIYALIFKICQNGEGEIMTFIKFGKTSISNYEGHTHKVNDVTTSFNLLSLDVGDKVWLEAKRFKGTCKIGWCTLSGWLFS